MGYATTTISDADLASYPVFTYNAGLDRSPRSTSS